MQDIVNTAVLICAAIASLGLGVLLALAVCKAGFAALRLHARSSVPQPVKTDAQTARV
jgi:hypothetical protein